VITQLRDVRTAGESTEVPVKDQQKPMPPEFFEPVGIAAAVAEIKRNGGFSGEVFQGELLPISGLNFAKTGESAN